MEQGCLAHGSLNVFREAGCDGAAYFADEAAADAEPALSTILVDEGEVAGTPKAHQGTPRAVQQRQGQIMSVLSRALDLTLQAEQHRGGTGTCR